MTGSIPQTITKLKNLKMLRLSWTNLSGPVPEFLSQLNELTFLDLSFNQFSGEIPANLGKLTKLDALHLDRNRLTGPIPDSFGRFTGSVPDMYLSHNQLTGSIPKSLGNMGFGRIDLSRNKLTGDASMLFNLNGSTQTIDLSRNMLEFDLSKVEFPKSLISLDLNHNQIFGSIPKQITELHGLQFLNVSYNQLCGEIPNTWNLTFRPEAFDESSYIHNRCLCGLPLSIKCTFGISSIVVMVHAKRTTSAIQHGITSTESDQLAELRVNLNSEIMKQNNLERQLVQDRELCKKKMEEERRAPQLESKQHEEKMITLQATLKALQDNQQGLTSRDKEVMPAHSRISARDRLRPRGAMSEEATRQPLNNS
ncbi:hypothetical protein GIB67_018741 [Kingdonia uniflora]|uniref:Uncharacterized protein n=1 Tax=Kingdonia uniflora TaxID=39325 RepID=A0A7J7LSI6_9MAGN|nr:hypothetical protein GIB67_018741 [Kingdonia uniflora]